MTFEFAGRHRHILGARAGERTSYLCGRTDAARRKWRVLPIVTPLGEMLMFTVVGGDLTPMEQRSLVDWTIRPRLRGRRALPTSTCSAASVRTFEVVPSPSQWQRAASPCRC